MSMWHVMLGVGVGLLATILTIIANQQKHRAISHSSKETFVSLPGEMCVICLTNMTNNEMKYLNCGHAFHEECLRQLRRHRDNKCPTCRSAI